VTLLEFFLAATGAGVVATDILQRIAQRFAGAMVAVWTVDMVFMAVLVIVVAIGAVDVGFVGHGTTPE
jgi:hypothetical protein